MRHERTVALVWGTEPPAFSIGYEKPLGPGDSGFTVLFDDAPDPADVGEAGHPAITTVCLRCLIDDHPEIGRGLDIAGSTAWRILTTTACGSWVTSAGSIPFQR